MEVPTLVRKARIRAQKAIDLMFWHRNWTHDYAHLRKVAEMPDRELADALRTAGGVRNLVRGV
jgi:hypothetical protein